MEEMRKVKRKNPDGTPKKRTKKKKDQEAQQMAALAGQGVDPLGVFDPSSLGEKPPGHPAAVPGMWL